MITMLHALIIIAFSLPGLLAMKSESQLAVDKTTSFTCQMTLSNTIYVNGTHGQEVACIYRKDFIWPIDNFPSQLYESKLADITQGQLWMRISPASVIDGRMVPDKITSFTVLSSMHPSLAATYPQNASLGEPLSLQSRAVGNQTIFIIRVVTTDSTPPVSLSQLKKQIFGRSLNDFKPSLRNQFKACSFGQLQFSYAGGKTVNIASPVTSFPTAAALVQAALTKIANRRGLSSASQLADKVMIVLPPGTTGDWVSNAAVNYWRSTYNTYNGKVAAMSLSIGMHEISHNLGLLHSGEGANGTELAYGDSTGYMGNSLFSSKYPLKCFNAFKNWQLGWYASNQLRVTDYSKPRLVTMISFVDYKTAGDNPVLINLSDIFFLQFNRAKSFNIDTGEKQNMLTVTRNDLGRSQAIAGLDIGQSYIQSDWQGNKRPLVIAVCSISFNDKNPEQTDHLIVSIGLGKSHCSKKQLQ